MVPHGRRESGRSENQAVDKEWLRKKAEEIHAALGIEYDPHATIEQARELMRAQGIRPEDNVFSRVLTGCDTATIGTGGTSSRRSASSWLALSAESASMKRPPASAGGR